MATTTDSSNAAIATGLLWLCSTLLFLFFDPVRGGRTQEDFYRAVAADPLLYQLPRVSLAVTAFVGLAAVLAISRVVGDPSGGWLRWSTVLVVIGLALTGISQARFALINPERAAIYVGGDKVTQLAIEANRFTLQLDPHGIIGTLSLVVWLVSINVLALRKGSWRRSVSLLGIAVATVSAVGVGGRGLGLASVTQLTSLVNGLLAPVWFLWVGFTLRTRNRREAA